MPSFKSEVKTYVIAAPRDYLERDSDRTERRKSWDSEKEKIRKHCIEAVMKQGGFRPVLTPQR